MGTTTTRRALYKPSINEVGWGDLVNGNIDELDKVFPFIIGADVASEAALFNALGFPVTANYFDITGNTGPVTSIEASGQLGTVVGLHFDSTPTFNHGASLVLPGGQNITVAANDEMTFVEFEAGKWRLIAWVHDVTGTGKEVLATSPTIVTPTIADLSNMTHDHGEAASGGAIIVAGTKMLFKQAAAPTGWTIDDTITDKSAVRYTRSGTYGADGGTADFGDTHTHTVSHTHNVALLSDGTTLYANSTPPDGSEGSFTYNLTATMSGGSGDVARIKTSNTNPTTSASTAPRYTDVIVATKD